MSRRSKRKQLSSVLPELARPDETVPRRLRVEGDLKQCVVAALRELGDPRVRGVTVTRVEMTHDLQLARIYVRLGLDVAPQASPSADD
ncbi:MAG: ribosome-binding factor A, partial [Polyangiaceae bacterium]